ncbi:FAD-binding protein [Arabiibacter massiliensis]|uniref:FAD-binding protein n=1 Tax=Arabiibacter massiliensis TaxID=1870985 RepID=UPI0009BA6F67|nr:FAD-binding protein [Arabiibacter massiliensis]
MGECMQDRRTFLKGAGVFAVASAAMAVTGCAPQAKDESASADIGSRASAEDVTWDKEYDVVVCGAGIAGLVAAATVATEGDGATCLLLEKDAAPNGNSPFCLGMQMYTEHPDELLVYIKELIGSATPEDVIEAYVDGLTESLPWIKGLGANEGDMRIGEWKPDAAKLGEYPELPNDDCVTSFGFTGKAGGAGHIHEFLEQVIDQYADVVDYKTSTPLESLVQDADGIVVGVVAAGKSYKASRGVIMCTGGFENDSDLMYTHTGVRGVKPICGQANTGDGHRACMKVGADMWHMHGGAQFWMACRDLENKRHISKIWNYSNKRWGITVGVNGRRFYQDFDGCGAYGLFAGLEDAEALAKPDSDMSCNVGYRHGITQWGGNWTHLPMPEKAWFVFDQNGLEAGAMDPEVSQDVVADGWAVAADSIEELASLIEVPTEELTRTVALWNRYCDQGEDEAFFRPAETLQPISQAPYYAMLCAPAVLNTDGGPVRDAKARILDPFGNPIPHLYSAGEFGSIWGHLYVGSGNVGECSVFGRIAARSALAGE